jgi:Fe-S-cluster containining protein
MIEDYRKAIAIAKSKKKENKKFLDRLKKQKPVDLDVVTNQLHKRAFERIDCMKCGNCCKTTSPMLRNKDIGILARHFHLRISEFTERYLRIDEDGDFVLKKTPCPFLGDENRCTVYDSRPTSCREYPHTQQKKIHQKLPITYVNSMICPAVAQIVEKLKIVYGKP